MPIEVKEIIISAKVVDKENTSSSPSIPTQNGAPTSPDHQAIIQECVNQVMFLLKQPERR